MEAESTVKPYNIEKSKKAEVRNMFNNISGRYDFLNRVLSLRIDKLWRKKIIKEVTKHPHTNILDVATGTADLAIECAYIDGAKSITGIDISDKMIEVGKEKIKAKELSSYINLKVDDAEDLSFSNHSFDIVTVAFGVRNFEDLDKGLREIKRVLKPGGMLAVLEFSKPTTFPIKQLYLFYFKNILPLIGRLLSKDKRAYSYLFESVDAFPYGKDFTDILERNGFKNTKCRPLSLGIASMYLAYK